MADELQNENIDEMMPLDDVALEDVGAPDYKSERNAEVRPVAFQSFSSQSSQIVDTSNIDILMDVTLPLAVQLGKTRMTVREILGLGPGSVIELDKAAGEPVDLYVNDKLIARGEVVVIDENFGLRIVEIMSSGDDMAK